MASESGAFEIKPMDQFIITPLFSEGDLNGILSLINHFGCLLPL